MPIRASLHGEQRPAPGTLPKHVVDAEGGEYSGAMSKLGESGARHPRARDEVRLAEVLAQDGLLHPVESVVTEKVWYATLCLALAAALAGCRSTRAAPEPEAAATQAAPPCEGERIAAHLFVLSVDGMDGAAARRIEALLADEFRAGIVSATADPSTELVTMLVRADADVTVGSASELLAGLGFRAREADEAAYAAARSDLASQTLAIPVTGSSVHPGLGSSSVESLEESLTPLRTRFNGDKGLLRFIALLSPT
jgi:hypothetical protein